MSGGDKYEVDPQVLIDALIDALNKAEQELNEAMWENEIEGDS